MFGILLVNTHEKLSKSQIYFKNVNSLLNFSMLPILVLNLYAKFLYNSFNQFLSKIVNTVDYHIGWPMMTGISKSMISPKIRGRTTLKSRAMIKD